MELPPALAQIRLESLEPVAGNAVFRLPDGKAVVLDRGKALGETGAVLSEVRRDHVVLLLTDEQRRLAVWMYPAEDPGKPGRVRIVSWKPPEDARTSRPAGQEKPVEVKPRPPRP